MIQRAKVVLAALACVVLPVSAAAQAAASQPAPGPSIRVGTTIFYDYTYTYTPKTTDANGNQVSRSAFDVQRAYINVTGTLSPLIAFRVTPDVRREISPTSSLNGSLTFRIKYAYAEFRLDEWMPAGSLVRAGIIQTPFIDAVESIYRYRFQGTVFAERDGGLSSADAGVSLRTVLPSNYGDVVVGLYNGDGYSKAEPNDQKSLQLRGTVRPFASQDGIWRGLRATAFINEDHYVAGATRRRFIANAVFEHRRFNAGTDFLLGSDQMTATASEADSRGFSFFVTPFFQEKGKGFEGLVRYDYFKANTDVDTASNRIIVGGAYWFPNTGSATAALLLDFEQVTASGSAASAIPKQQRLAVHGLINF